MAKRKRTGVAPAAAGAAFVCPGGCGATHPLGEGHLVIEHQEHSRRTVTERTNRNEPLVALLCGPCTAALVLARAGSTSGKVRT